MHDLSASPGGRDGAAFEVMSDAVLGILGELSVDAILQKLVNASRELGRARYAALGIPDGCGGFAKFLSAGMSDARAALIGDLPRTHGLLGATLDETASWRVPDIREDPRFEGWPDLHPEMRAFMGVPICLRGRVIGAFYLTHTAAARRFSDDDQRVIELLAAHAAVAIENARPFERSRELCVIEERNRLARELHDSVTQTLFSLDLTAAAAATLVERDPDKAIAEILRLQELARSAIAEMRSLVFELRAPELDSDGFVPTLRKHVEILRRVHRTDVRLEVVGDRSGAAFDGAASDPGLDRSWSASCCGWPRRPSATRSATRAPGPCAYGWSCGGSPCGWWSQTMGSASTRETATCGPPTSGSPRCASGRGTSAARSRSCRARATAPRSAWRSRGDRRRGTQDPRAARRRPSGGPAGAADLPRAPG
jgi:GAF domain-containing protein